MTTDPNKTRLIQIEFYQAIAKESKERVQELINQGAKPNEDAGGSGTGRPLIIALQRENFQIAELLLQHGADPQTHQASPLRESAALGNKEACNFLFQKAHFNQFPLARLCAYICLQNYDEVKDLADILPELTNADEEAEPVHCCVKNNDPKALKILLEAGWPPDHNDGYMGVHALSIACSSPNKNSEVVDLLLEFGANPNSGDDQRDDGVPLLNAVEHQKNDIVEILIDALADPFALEGEIVETASKNPETLKSLLKKSQIKDINQFLNEKRPDLRNALEKEIRLRQSHQANKIRSTEPEIEP